MWQTQKEITEYETKVNRAKAYLTSHEGKGQAARHSAALNGEQIDSAQWAEAEKVWLEEHLGGIDHCPWCGSEDLRRIRMEEDDETYECNDCEAQFGKEQ